MELALVANEAAQKVLDDVELADGLIELPGWEVKGKQIVKVYVFETFQDSMEFVNKVAAVAEELNHHPDIHISFKKVKTWCWTHKFNSVTQADIIIAGRIEEIFAAGG